MMFFQVLAVELLFDYVTNPSNFPSERFVWGPDAMEEFCSLLLERGAAKEAIVFWGEIILRVATQRYFDCLLDERTLVAMLRGLRPREHLFFATSLAFSRLVVADLPDK